MLSSVPILFVLMMSEEYLWKFICDKINAKCRGVTRTLKRKSSIWEVQSSSVIDNESAAASTATTNSTVELQYEPSNSTHSQPAYKYRKESYNLERCSFVTSASSADFHHTLSRFPSSSDSETSSVDLPHTALPPPPISASSTTEGGRRSWNLLQDNDNRCDETIAAAHNLSQSSTSSSVSCFASVSSSQHQNSSTQNLSDNRTSIAGSRSSSAPVMRSSFASHTSSSSHNNKITEEATTSCVKQKSLADDEEEDDIEIKVDDEEDDVSVDDDGIAEHDRYSNYDRVQAQPVTVLQPPEIRSISSPPALLNSSVTSQSALELCDRLAEKYMETFVNSTRSEDRDDDGTNTELTVTEQKKRIQSNREEFTRTLIEAMFTRSTLAHSNVTGARGKFMLDPVKIAKVRDTVFLKFPAECEDEEETVWKILTTKINTKCRGVKRLMKRKGIPAERIANRYQGVLDNINKMNNSENSLLNSSKNFVKINNSAGSGNSSTISTYDSLMADDRATTHNKIDISEHSPHGTISSSGSSTKSMSPTLVRNDDL